MEAFRGYEETSDRYIPYHLFQLLYKNIPHIEAKEKLQEVSSLKLAIAASFDDDQEIVRALNDLRDKAFPELR